MTGDEIYHRAKRAARRHGAKLQPADWGIFVLTTPTPTWALDVDRGPRAVCLLAALLIGTFTTNPDPVIDAAQLLAVTPQWVRAFTCGFDNPESTEDKDEDEDGYLAGLQARHLWDQQDGNG